MDELEQIREGEVQELAGRILGEPQALGESLLRSVGDEWVRDEHARCQDCRGRPAT